MFTRKGLVAGVAVGIALGVAAVAGVDAATEPADAQSGFTVTPEQLQINQRISSAAVKRSNRSLNYLAPIRTSGTDAADDGSNGVKPLANVPGAGLGWTTTQIANAAITSAKLANDSVTTNAIAPGAVETSDLNANTANGLAFWASVNETGAAQSFFAQRGATAVVRDATTNVYAVTFQQAISQAKCSVSVTPSGTNPNIWRTAYYLIASNGTVLVSIVDETAGQDSIPSDFSIQVWCNP